MLNLGLLEQNRKPDQQMDAGGASRGQNTGGALGRVLLELVCVPRAGAGARWSRLVGAVWWEPEGPTTCAWAQVLLALRFIPQFSVSVLSGDCESGVVGCVSVSDAVITNNCVVLFTASVFPF